MTDSAPRLLPGSANFQVTEVPAYPPSGVGEHLYVEIEKEGLSTDAVAETLAKALGRRQMDVGYAGRKDRHAITRQWFSVHFGDEARLAGLAAPGQRGRITVLAVARHANKLRLGHLTGNRFRLGIGGIADQDALARRLAELARQGILNRFGAQRFGVNGSTLAIARAWGAGDAAAAVARMIDADGLWRFGDPLPEGFRPGPNGQALGALRRKPDDARGAWRAAGDQFHKLVASAAQSAIFNAVLDARVAAGLLHRLRVGDLGLTARGATFAVTAEELDATNARCASGVLDAFTSAPLPGTSRLRPSAEIDAEERAWSAPVGIDWAWLDVGGTLESRGERRALVVPFSSAPTLEPGDGCSWLSFALPAGSYATEVLEQAGIAVPDERGG